MDNFIWLLKMASRLRPLELRTEAFDLLASKLPDREVKSYVALWLMHRMKMEIQPNYQFQDSWKHSMDHAVEQIEEMNHIEKRESKVRWYFDGENILDMVHNRWQASLNKAIKETGVDKNKATKIASAAKPKITKELIRILISENAIPQDDVDSLWDIFLLHENANN